MARKQGSQKYFPTLKPPGKAKHVCGGGGWIRTSEAFASDLQSDPFGHSGTPPGMERHSTPGICAVKNIWQFLCCKATQPLPRADSCEVFLSPSCAFFFAFSGTVRAAASRHLAEEFLMVLAWLLVRIAARCWPVSGGKAAAGDPSGHRVQAWISTGID